MDFSHAIPNRRLLLLTPSIKHPNCKKEKEGKSVHILPFGDSMKGNTVGCCELLLKFYFKHDRNRVFLRNGDRFTWNGIEFKVIKTNPAKHCVVGPETEIFCQGEPLRRGDEVGYDAVGGLGKTMPEIIERVKLLFHPELFKSMGVKPTKGILLYGPTGSGKGLMSRAVANETGVRFYSIKGQEILSKFAGESESNLRKVFEEAKENAPAIIFIDEIESIAKDREKTNGGVGWRTVSQLSILMDGLKSVPGVMVIGATNCLDSIDPALRRFGRFDWEIEIDVPDEAGRLEVLCIHTKNMKLAEDVDLESISKYTPGFVAADLAAVCTEASLQRIREKMDGIDLEDESIDAEILNSMPVTNEHFHTALRAINPSVHRV